MAQSVAHTLGKGEVTSSNLVISTNNIMNENTTEAYSKLYKLVLLQLVSDRIANTKAVLAKELLTQAADDTIFKRRFRMLSHLATYEAQIYQKIYNFETDDMGDYGIALLRIFSEIKDNVANRNG